MKFMVLYCAAVSASDLMANAKPEEMQASMAEWMTWRESVMAKGFKVDFGMPLQALTRITPDSMGDSKSQASGYSIIEGDSREELIELLKRHPHLKRDGASIDLFEMLSMPGMDAQVAQPA